MPGSVRSLIMNGFDEALVPTLALRRHAPDGYEALFLVNIIRELNDYWLGENDPDVLLNEVWP